MNHAQVGYTSPWVFPLYGPHDFIQKSLDRLFWEAEVNRRSPGMPLVAARRQTKLMADGRESTPDVDIITDSNN